MDDLVVGQMYAIYVSVPDLDDWDEVVAWDVLPAHVATFLGVGDRYGDLLAVFRSEQDNDPVEDRGGIIVVPEEDLSPTAASGGTAVLPLDESDL